MTGRDIQPLSDRARLDWLQLSRSDGVGPIQFRRLLAAAGSAAAALAQAHERAGLASRAACEQELTRLRALGGRLVCLCEPDYPALLREIADPPPVISLMGEPAQFARPAVAVVGARNASANGRRFAATLARELAEAGWTVVSGLARGIDAAAHQGALEAGDSGATLAVAAGGIDVVYPPEHEALQREIARRGLLIGEQPLGVKPQARDFPRRNRLVSGLAWGVVVVEAAERSGSLITARLAGEQGRLLFAVPGSPPDPRARGCNALLRDGAILTESAADVLEALSPMLTRPRVAAATAPSRPAPATEADLQAPAIQPDARPPDAPEAVERLLGPTPVPVDELIRQCQLSPSIVNQVLVELELAGRIERQPGNRVSLVTDLPGRTD